jgi:hypothetical protein
MKKWPCASQARLVGARPRIFVFVSAMYPVNRPLDASINVLTWSSAWVAAAVSVRLKMPAVT